MQFLADLIPLLSSPSVSTGVLNALAPRRGIMTFTGLPYGPEPRHKLDLYAPQSAESAPVVIFLYGGGWDSGDRKLYRFVGASLAAAGLVCVIPDYRLWPAVKFPSFMGDAARAVAWTRARIASMGGDPHRLFLMGHSAGAHMAALLGLDGHHLSGFGMDPRRDLRGVIGLAGPYDFLPLRDETLKNIFGPEEDWPGSQPINFAHGEAPPMLLATGDADRAVLPRNTLSLSERLKTLGAEVEAIIYPRIGHELMIGVFSWGLEAGLPLYWAISTLFSIVQQYFITGWGKLFEVPQFGGLGGLLGGPSPNGNAPRARQTERPARRPAPARQPSGGAANRGKRKRAG